MALLLVLLLGGLAPGALAQCNVERAQPLLRRSAYEFAVRLSTRVAQETDYHFVLSTFSLWALLATASLGAAGDTLDEFRRVLRLHRQPCFNDRYFELARAAAAADAGVERASAIFAAAELGVTDEFRRRVRAAGAADVVELSFADPEAAAAAIGEHVSRATHGRIADLLAPEDVDGVSFVMIDALHFGAPWRTPFPLENTERRPFYDEAGGRLGDVEMMRTVGVFNVSHVELLRATALELPLGAAGRVALLLLLPERGVPPGAVLDALGAVSLATVYALFARDEPETVSVELPRFETASELTNLRELLADMGLRAPFDAAAAQFPLVAAGPLFVADVVQKASVAVSEAGATASAASAGLFVSRSSPLRLRADRPFLYLIVDTATRIPLFCGAFSRPG